MAEGLGKSFIELMEDGFYYAITDSHINPLWYLSLSEDKSKVYGKSCYGAKFDFNLTDEKSGLDSFLKTDHEEILNSPTASKKSKDFIKKKLDEISNQNP